MNTAVLGGIAFLFSCGLLFQLLCCVLYSNWWPMLTAIMYVMMPIPVLFFSSGSSSDFIMMGSSGGGEWEDAGKFLTGFTAVGSIAIPAILHHGGLITFGALAMQLLALLLLGSSVLLFMKFSLREHDSNSLWR